MTAAHRSESGFRPSPFPSRGLPSIFDERVRKAVLDLTDGPMPFSGLRLSVQKRVRREHLNPIVMLKLVDGLEPDIVPGEVEIRVDDGAVLPIGGETRHSNVEQVLFVKELAGRAEGNVVWVEGGVSYVVRSIAVRNLDKMQFGIRKGLDVAAEIVGQLAAGPPAEWIAVRSGDVEGLSLGPGAMCRRKIGVMKMHAIFKT